MANVITVFNRTINPLTEDDRQNNFSFREQGFIKALFLRKVAGSAQGKFKLKF